MRAFRTEPLGQDAALLRVDKKLRGSVARQLHAQLWDLVDQGYREVVIDLGATTTFDSLASMAMEHALDRGVRLGLVAPAGFDLDAYGEERRLLERGLQVAPTLAAARAALELPEPVQV